MRIEAPRVEELSREAATCIESDNVMLPGCENLTYSGIFNRYAGSIFGQSQAQQALRYSNRYPYERETMLRDLGDDVHPLRHMPYTEAQVFRPLVAVQNSEQGVSQRFSAEEIAAGRIAALLHDTGECEHLGLIEHCGATVGDVNFLDKTEADEVVEARIRQHFYVTLYADVPATLLEVAEDTIAHNSGSFLRDSFATTERIGYFMTGVQAGVVALDLRQKDVEEGDELRYSQLSRLALEVAPHWYKELGPREDRFAFVRHIRQAMLPSLELITAELTR